jgi:hypothetical protein
MTDPRYRPARRPTAFPTEELSPEELRRTQLAVHPWCQWQARAVRCVAEAVLVVRSREGVLRSSCPGHVAAWVRVGAELV